MSIEYRFHRFDLRMVADQSKLEQFHDINIQYPFFSGAATLLLGLLVGIIGLRKKTADNPIPV